jgi:hypothetical protein
MKIVILFSLLISSSYVFGGTLLECKNNATDGVYSLAIEDSGRTATLTPVVVDGSSLSESVTTLTFEEGESSPNDSSYGGVSETGTKVALNLAAGHGGGTILSLKPIKATVYYTVNRTNYLDGKAKLVCTSR